jgi:hypothetical protein
MPYSELVARGIIQGALLRGNTCSYSVELGSVGVVRSLKPLGNTTIAIVYPGPTLPIAASAQQSSKEYASASGSTPLACVAAAPCGSSASAVPLLTSTPIAPAVSYGSEWRDGTIVAVAIATGLAVAIAMYIILSRRMLS